MLGDLAGKLKGVISSIPLVKKKIGSDKQGAAALDPFGAPDADPFGASAQPDMGGFGDAGMPDMGGDMGSFGGDMGGGFGDAGMPDMGGGFGDAGMPDMGGDMGGFGAPGGGSAPQSASAPADSELSLENAEKLTELSSKLAKVDVSVSTIQRASDEMRETVNRLDESVLELLSLYEIVSNQVNPFVGEGDGDSETIERFDKVEKRINAVGESLVMLQNDFEAQSQHAATGLSDEARTQLNELNSRFEVLTETVEAMQSENNNISQEELEKIITEKIEEAMHDIPVNAVPIDGPPQSGELIHVGAATSGISGEILSEDLARLDHLDKNPMTAVVLLNWIEFLMERVGRNNLMDALDYYVDIEWIGERVRDEMLAYARGIDYYVEKPTWRLLPEDHTKSLIFIERLRGHRIDRNMLSTIEREMSKVKHGLEELYGI